MMDIEPNDEYHVTMHNINLNINPWGGKRKLYLMKMMMMGVLNEML